MKIQTLPRFMLVLGLTACGLPGTTSKDEPTAAAPSTEQVEPKQFAIVRAPLDADGEPVLSLAVLRTGVSQEAIQVDDETLVANFSNLGTETKNTLLSSEDELDQSTSTESWFLLPWRARIANGEPVRSGPYLLPWRSRIANGQPVRERRYLLPFRRTTAQDPCRINSASCNPQPIPCNGAYGSCGGQQFFPTYRVYSYECGVQW